MKAPESLQTLIEYGIIEEVIRPLMSGKEAQVFIVVAGGEECVAKVYKEAMNRTFKHRSDYTEGRRTRNTRDQRAMSKRTQHGKKKDEDAWRSTEVDMIYRLRDAGVRVPEPMNFVEGVLVMELVKDADGEAAPRLGDLNFSPAEAKAVYDQLIREVVRMLSAGVIHGDMSEFNVLMAGDGPVVIDFPQSIDPTHNPNGEKILLRDVENLHRFLARSAPEEVIRPYGQEIWKLFQTNKLHPDTKLTGVYAAPEGKVNTTELMDLIEDANKDEARRRAGPKLSRDEDDEFEAARDALKAAPTAFRKVVDFAQERSSRPAARKQAGSGGDGQKQAESRPRRRSRNGQNTPADSNSGSSSGAAAARPARGRRPNRSGPSESRPKNENAASQKTPPRGPRALRERESGQAGEGTNEDRPASARRPRNRRGRGGAPKSGTELGARAEGSPKPPAERPGPEAGSASSGDSRPKAGKPANRGPAPNESAGPAKRRRRRRPRNKPDGE